MVFPAGKIFSRGKWVRPGLVLIVCMVLAVWKFKLVVEERILEDLYLSGRARATLYTRTLKDSLEKYRHLPYVLARDARIRSLLKKEIDEIKVNPHLDDFATATGALIFVLDKGGTTVATSNWRTERSLLGHSYNFRPYFLDARNGKPGGYYAVGLQTRKPGYFISYPVLEMGELQGVVVVKVDLEPLQQSWRAGNEMVMVSDAYGVLILSSNPEWTYSVLQPLSEQTRKRLRLNQYLETSLDTLQVSRKDSEYGNLLTIYDTPYLEISGQLPGYGWRLHYLVEVAQVKRAGRLAVATALVFSAMVFLVLLYSHERKERLISHQEAQDAGEIRKLNLRLQEEISEHTRTEENLRNTQRELLQAGKLAALGRMSAAVAHELNQPVTAIRTFLASSRILITRGQLAKVEQNLSLISSLTDRMANITGQLKDFSRKSTPRNDRVDLVERVNRVLEFIAPQLAKQKIMVHRRMVPSGEMITRGDSVRIEQVIHNVLQNGIEAVKEKDVREIEIIVRKHHDQAEMVVSDSGDGIGDDVLEYLFEPFFTTRQSGEGLGLGLSISYGIMQDLGGAIQAENNAHGGARFTLRFPCDAENQRKEIGS